MHVSRMRTSFCTILLAVGISAQIPANFQSPDPKFPSQRSLGSPFSSDLIDRIKAAKEQANHFGPISRTVFSPLSSGSLGSGRTARIVDDASFFSTPDDSTIAPSGGVLAQSREFLMTDEASSENNDQLPEVHQAPIESPPEVTTVVTTTSTRSSSVPTSTVNSLLKVRRKGKETTATATTISNFFDDIEPEAASGGDSSKTVLTNRPKSAGQLGSLENPGEKKTLVVGKQAAALEQITKTLVSRFGITPDQIRNQLPLIQVSQTVKQDCLTSAEEAPKVPLDDPFSVELPECARSKFRSFDGSCNNIAFPNRGTSASIFLRMMEPDYADSISEPRRSKRGKPLPSARAISKRVASNDDVASATTTLMFMQFGQFIDHDITNTPKARGLDKLPPQCCFEDPGKETDPACFPIPVPLDDAFLGPLNQTCMEFVRSLPGTRPGCTLGPREQVNQNTAYIDGSAIYGLSDSKAQSLRTMELGQLKSFSPKDDPHYMLLPQNPKNAECIDANENKMCFKAGDSRANVHLGIAEFQTLWLRHHNRIANILHEFNPHWRDEKLFHEARHITVAQLQHITYNEFLPILLGDQMLDKWNLRLLNSGRFREYNMSMHPGILNEFATAAYRVGHTMVQNAFRRTDKDYKFRGSENLKTTFFHPFALYDKDAFDEVILGMVSSPTQEIDNNFVDELTNHLFEIPGDAFGLDLTALNIQRGRDHGIPGWMKWRQLCGLPTATNFDELRAMNIIPSDIADKMEDQYNDIEDVDLYIAGTAENHVTGGKVGPTFACIIADQFRRLRFGDRFWYENDLPLSSSLSDKQVEAIRSTTMSRILCDNTPMMEAVQAHAFLLPDAKTNPVVPCKSIPSTNYRRWKVRLPKAGRSLDDAQPEEPESAA